jgi:hypothetical protein
MRVPHYFVVSDADLAAFIASHPQFEWFQHNLDVGTQAGKGWHAMVIRGEPPGWSAPATWHAMPHMLDSAATIPAAAVALLADAGVKATHNTFQAAKSMGSSLCPAFHPS